MTAINSKLIFLIFPNWKYKGWMINIDPNGEGFLKMLRFCIWRTALNDGHSYFWHIVHQMDHFDRPTYWRILSEGLKAHGNLLKSLNKPTFWKNLKYPLKESHYTNPNLLSNL